MMTDTFILWEQSKQKASAYVSVVGWIKKTLMFLSSGWHFVIYHILKNFLPQTHTDRKHLNSERTSTVIPHRLHPSIFKELKPCDTPNQSSAQKGLQDERKGKKWDPLISAMHWWPCQLYGQFAQESRKNPIWRMTCGGGRLNFWASWILLK